MDEIMKSGTMIGLITGLILAALNFFTTGFFFMIFLGPFYNIMKFLSIDPSTFDKAILGCAGESCLGMHIITTSIIAIILCTLIGYLVDKFYYRRSFREGKYL